MLRFVLFGAGRAGRIHGRNIAAHPRAELVLVHDVNREAAERLCGEFGGTDLTDGLRAQLIAEAAVQSLATNRPVQIFDCRGGHA